MNICITRGTNRKTRQKEHSNNYFVLIFRVWQFNNWIAKLRNFPIFPILYAAWIRTKFTVLGLNTRYFNFKGILSCTVQMHCMNDWIMLSRYTYRSLHASIMNLCKYSQCRLVIIARLSRGVRTIPAWISSRHLRYVIIYHSEDKKYV